MTKRCTELYEEEGRKKWRKKRRNAGLMCIFLGPNSGQNHTSPSMGYVVPQSGRQFMSHFYLFIVFRFNSNNSFDQPNSKNDIGCVIQVVGWYLRIGNIVVEGGKGSMHPTLAWHYKTIFREIATQILAHHLHKHHRPLKVSSFLMVFGNKICLFMQILFLKTSIKLLNIKGLCLLLETSQNNEAPRTRGTWHLHFCCFFNWAFLK